MVMNGEEGPVIIDDGARVMPNTCVFGPAYIGKGSVIKSGARIYPGTTIGEVCKIGGEVDNSIFHGYSNKQHDGFIGHSYIGSWVNLGAGTSNSDLQNNYGPVKVFLNGRKIDTGRNLVGLFMGDYSKSAINTAFNTGSVVGVSCNLFGRGLLPGFIPGFSWGVEGKTYSFPEAVSAIRSMMARRNKKLSSCEFKILVELFRLARREKEKCLPKN